MKKRVANKSDKKLTNLAIVCERIANTVVDKVSGALKLQATIDEYQRFLGDLLIMTIKGEQQCVVEHNVDGDQYMTLIWNNVRSIIKENKDLKAKLAQDLQKK